MVEPSADRETKPPFPQIWAKLAVLSFIIGQAAALLSNLEVIRGTITKWIDIDQFLSLNRWIILLAPLSVGIGFAGIAYWAYSNLLKAASSRTKIVAATLAILGIPISAMLTYLAIPSPDNRSLIADQQRTFQITILEQQIGTGLDKGGFRFSTKGQSNDAQAWTTAQCLVALLSSPATIRSSALRIREGFTYLERTRMPKSGWGYMANDGVGVTEINAWVLIAESRSMQPSNGLDIWPSNMHAGLQRRILDDVKDITSRQHEDGGWGPLPKTDRKDYERTYSTIMATWALIESRDAQLISSHPDWQYDENITRGVRWLLNHYVEAADGTTG